MSQEIANCELIINEYGSRVPKHRVTPAEVQFLIHSFSEITGRFPIVDLKPITKILDKPNTMEIEDRHLNGQPYKRKVELALQPDEALKSDVERTSIAEFNRLKLHYMPNHPDKDAITLEKMWPGTTPSLPQKFSDVVDAKGTRVFTEGGQRMVEATPEPDTVTINGKTYTKAQLAEVLAEKSEKEGED